MEGNITKGYLWLLTVTMNKIARLSKMILKVQWFSKKENNVRS